MDSSFWFDTLKKVNKQCLLDSPPPTSKGQWKNLVLASDSSNQQTLVLNNISVESVQMIFKLAI